MRQAAWRRRIMPASRRLCLLGVLVGCTSQAVIAADVSAEDIQAQRTGGEAAATLRQANERLATVPNDPQTRFIKASALADLGRADEAIVVLDKLAAAYPQRADVANNLGVLLARAGRLNEAREQLADAVRHAPVDASEYAEIQRNLGDVYLALAGQAYERAGNTAAARRDGVYQLLPVLSRIDQPRTARDAPGAAADELQTAARAVLTRRAKGRAAGDLQAVLSTYSERYEPPEPQSRAEWLTGLRDDLKTGSPGPAPAIVDLSATSDGATRIQADYRQADDAPEAAKHRAILVREDGQWRIVADR